MTTTEQQITNAADQLTETIALKMADLADEILGRPATGSNEWLEQYRYYEENPKAKAQALREWHLTKLAICREAKVHPVGEVLNARANGASWQTIADVYGISRQAAYERWAKYDHHCQECGRLLPVTSSYDPTTPEQQLCYRCQD